VTRRRLLLLGGAATLALGVSTAFAATLGVGSWHLWAGSQTLTKASCTVTGAAVDTYVDQSTPTSTFSTNTIIGTRSTSGSRVYTFIRFDLSSCAIPSTGGADSATLKLRLTTAPASNRTINVAPVLSSWTGALTWNSSLGLSIGPTTTSFTTGTTSNVTLNATVTADVDDLIKSGTANYGWRLSDSTSATSATSVFASTEAASNDPQLVINYEK
jgi:hypothetical protein